MILRNKKFVLTLLIALFIKLSLFAYAEIRAPQAKFQIDSEIYTQTANNLAAHGAFTTEYKPDRKYSPELLRTPGYPVFLALLNGKIKIPYSGVIVIQILLTIATALITYRTAANINPRLAYLSAFIVLYDLPVTIFSLMLLTETLFLFLLSIFMYFFVRYLREKKLRYVIVSALIVAMAAYVRPVAYFFGAAIGAFLLYFSLRTKLKIVLAHVLIFLIITYSLIGIWHYKNYKTTGSKTFSTITHLAASYRKHFRHDDAITKSLPPAAYYLNAVSRCFVSLMTRPGTFKNFNSSHLKDWGKFWGYPWVAFWMIGLLVGISKVDKDIYLQFLAYVLLYFICASIGGLLFGVSSRQRVPMVPFIAIISALGWTHIAALLGNKGEINRQEAKG